MANELFSRQKQQCRGRRDISIISFLFNETLPKPFIGLVNSVIQIYQRRPATRKCSKSRLISRKEKSVRMSNCRGKKLKFEKCWLENCWQCRKDKDALELCERRRTKTLKGGNKRKSWRSPRRVHVALWLI